MDDALLVRIVERVGRLAGDPERVLDRQLLLAVEPGAEGFALDERHGEPQSSRGFTRVEHGQDVGMLEPRREANLPLEPLRPERLRQLGVQHLERDRTIMAQVVGEIDRGHAAAPELTLDRVAVLEGVGQLFSRLGHAGSFCRGGTSDRH